MTQAVGTGHDVPGVAGMAVEAVDPRVDAHWHALASGPGGSLFTAPPWISAVSETYGFEPTARVLTDGSGAARAGFAWIDVRDMRGGRRLALPFSDRADPVVADTAEWAALSADAFAGELPLTLRCLDSSPAVHDPRFTAVGEAAWHVTSLDRGLDELHGAFRSQTRRNIAHAERAGVEVLLSPELGAVTEFHRLHVELRKRKYRLLAQPLDFFHRIWKVFSPSDGIMTALARVGGRPVAGAIYLVWQDTVYYKFGASRADSLPLRPNDAVHWALIRWASGRRLGRLDWGLSDLDQPGLVAYKRKWASTEARIRTLNAGGPPADQRPDVDRTLSVMTDLLTDPAVPDEVTARAGAAFYRFFC